MPKIDVRARKISDTEWHLTGTIGEEAPAPAPAPSPAPGPSWNLSFYDNWSRLNVGGWIRYDHAWGPVPPGSEDDMGMSIHSSFGVPTNGWAPSTTLYDTLSVQNDMLHCNSNQTLGQGFFLLSQRRFPKDRPLSAYVTLDLQRDEGSWIGMTLYNGEGNYREIGLTWVGGELRVIIHAPKYVRLLGTVQPGPRVLNLLYRPDAGWDCFVDGVNFYHEDIGFKKNQLLADPTLGLFFVNLQVESGTLPSGKVRASLDEVSVLEHY